VLTGFKAAGRAFERSRPRDLSNTAKGTFLAVPNIYAANNRQEKRRQKHFINLIPSENFTSQAVLDALGSVMQSPFAFRVHASACNLTIAQINIQKDILEQDITAVMSTLTNRSDSARSVRSRHIV